MASGQEELTAKVSDVYPAVWRKFYANADAFSRQILQSLAGSPEPQADSHTHGPVEIISLKYPETEVLTKGVEEMFTEYTISPEGTITMSLVPVDAVALSEETFLPSPPYEQCTPSLGNIRHGDDPNSLTFIPYADDPSFKSQVYTSEYRELEWQSRPAFLDVFWISLEAARCIVEDYDMTLQDVDDTQILPVPFCEPSPHWKKVWMLRKIECPMWLRPNLPTYESLVGSYHTTVCDVYGSLWSMLSVFCSNVNCVEAYCWAHDSEVHEFNQDTRYKLPASANIPLSIQPCRNSCHLMQGRSHKLSICGENEMADLDRIFQLFPEGSPCELSTLTRIPCHEVYALRITFSTRAQKGKQQSSVAQEQTVLHNNEHTPEKFDPCSHQGLCNSTNEECTCHANNIYCERTCCCPLDCPQRWRGCNCAMERGLRVKLCGLGRGCPCFEINRECDPELCDCFYHPDVTCTNSELRCGMQKRIKVAASSYGFGAFLTESARKDELICEYTGELIFGPTSETRDIVAKHRGRSYLYALNETFDVDASYSGNVARFINHAPKMRANCATHIKVVSGDHRIGLYAKRQMAAGTELMLDYGNQFFLPDQASQKSAGLSGPSHPTRNEQKKTKEGTK
ncbi:hypothetical protein PHLGIDRAFT_417179 [Phlebiopsis gigantea 11061_1 CR5-6]|uniref:SET domain-containing protein n=1 Tax=Phlebiopsis gigantea (strain 11061_1 CR5-6) TaxID=745531 RepID=A0A0C3P1X5_PHLG1|nr:hypothetical protein PHLGIDRAFT_417179 [Phlebiopsis gigantea 11061_1 CR5-6]